MIVEVSVSMAATEAAMASRTALSTAESSAVTISVAATKFLTSRSVAVTVARIGVIEAIPWTDITCASATPAVPKAAAKSLEVRSAEVFRLVPALAVTEPVTVTSLLVPRLTKAPSVELPKALSQVAPSQSIFMPATLVVVGLAKSSVKAAAAGNSESTVTAGIVNTSTCISLPEMALSRISTAVLIAAEFVSVIAPEVTVTSLLVPRLTKAPSVELPKALSQVEPS